MYLSQMFTIKILWEKIKKKIKFYIFRTNSNATSKMVDPNLLMQKIDLMPITKIHKLEGNTAIIFIFQKINK